MATVQRVTDLNESGAWGAGLLEGVDDSGSSVGSAGGHDSPTLLEEPRPAAPPSSAVLDAARMRMSLRATTAVATAAGAPADAIPSPLLRALDTAADAGAAPAAPAARTAAAPGGGVAAGGARRGGRGASRRVLPAGAVPLPPAAQPHLRTDMTPSTARSVSMFNAALDALLSSPAVQPPAAAEGGVEHGSGARLPSPLAATAARLGTLVGDDSGATSPWTLSPATVGPPLGSPQTGKWLEAASVAAAATASAAVAAAAGAVALPPPTVTPVGSVPPTPARGGFSYPLRPAGGWGGADPAGAHSLLPFSTPGVLAALDDIPADAEIYMGDEAQALLRRSLLALPNAADVLFGGGGDDDDTDSTSDDGTTPANPSHQPHPTPGALPAPTGSGSEVTPPAAAVPRAPLTEPLTTWPAHLPPLPEGGGERSPSPSTSPVLEPAVRSPPVALVEGGSGEWASDMPPQVDALTGAPLAGSPAPPSLPPSLPPPPPPALATAAVTPPHAATADVTHVVSILASAPPPSSRRGDGATPSWDAGRSQGPYSAARAGVNDTGHTLSEWLLGDDLSASGLATGGGASGDGGAATTGEEKRPPPPPLLPPAPSVAPTPATRPGAASSGTAATAATSTGTPTYASVPFSVGWPSATTGDAAASLPTGLRRPSTGRYSNTTAVPLRASFDSHASSRIPASAPATADPSARSCSSGASSLTDGSAARVHATPLTLSALVHPTTLPVGTGGTAAAAVAPLAPVGVAAAATAASSGGSDAALGEGRDDTLDASGLSGDAAHATIVAGMADAVARARAAAAAAPPAPDLRTVYAVAAGAGAGAGAGTGGIGGVDSFVGGGGGGGGSSHPDFDATTLGSSKLAEVEPAVGYTPFFAQRSAPLSNLLGASVVLGDASSPPPLPVLGTPPASSAASRVLPSTTAAASPLNAPPSAASTAPRRVAIDRHASPLPLPPPRTIAVVASPPLLQVPTRYRVVDMMVAPPTAVAVGGLHRVLAATLAASLTPTRTSLSLPLRNGGGEAAGVAITLEKLAVVGRLGAASCREEAAEALGVVHATPARLPHLAPGNVAQVAVVFDPARLFNPTSALVALVAGACAAAPATAALTPHAAAELVATVTASLVFCTQLQGGAGLAPAAAGADDDGAFSLPLTATLRLPLHLQPPAPPPPAPLPPAPPAPLPPTLPPASAPLHPPRDMPTAPPAHAALPDVAALAAVEAAIASAADARRAASVTAHPPTPHPPAPHPPAPHPPVPHLPEPAAPPAMPAPVSTPRSSGEDKPRARSLPAQRAAVPRAQHDRLAMDAALPHAPLPATPPRGTAAAPPRRRSFAGGSPFHSTVTGTTLYGARRLLSQPAPAVHAPAPAPASLLPLAPPSPADPLARAIGSRWQHAAASGDSAAPPVRSTRIPLDARGSPRRDRSGAAAHGSAPVPLPPPVTAAATLAAPSAPPTVAVVVAGVALPVAPPLPPPPPPSPPPPEPVTTTLPAPAPAPRRMMAMATVTDVSVAPTARVQPSPLPPPPPPPTAQTPAAAPAGTSGRTESAPPPRVAALGATQRSGVSRSGVRSPGAKHLSTTVTSAVPPRPPPTAPLSAHSLALPPAAGGDSRWMSPATPGTVDVVRSPATAASPYVVAWTATPESAAPTLPPSPPPPTTTTAAGRSAVHEDSPAAARWTRSPADSRVTGRVPSAGRTATTTLRTAGASSRDAALLASHVSRPSTALQTSDLTSPAPGAAGDLDVSPLRFAASIIAAPVADATHATLLRTAIVSPAAPATPPRGRLPPPAAPSPALLATPATLPLSPHATPSTPATASASLAVSHPAPPPAAHYTPPPPPQQPASRVPASSGGAMRVRGARGGSTPAVSRQAPLAATRGPPATPAAGGAAGWYVHPLTASVTLPPARVIAALRAMDADGRALLPAAQLAVASGGAVDDAPPPARARVHITSCCGSDLGVRLAQVGDGRADGRWVELTPTPLPLPPFNQAFGTLQCTLPSASAAAATGNISWPLPPGAVFHPARRVLRMVCVLEAEDAVAGDTTIASLAPPATGTCVRVELHEILWRAAGWQLDADARALVAAPSPRGSVPGASPPPRHPGVPSLSSSGGGAARGGGARTPTAAPIPPAPKAVLPAPGAAGASAMPPRPPRSALYSPEALPRADAQRATAATGGATAMPASAGLLPAARTVEPRRPGRPAKPNAPADTVDAASDGGSVTAGGGGGGGGGTVNSTALSIAAFSTDAAAATAGAATAPAHHALPGMYFTMRTVHFPDTLAGAEARVRIQLCNTAGHAVVARVSLLPPPDVPPHAAAAAIAAFALKRSHATVELRPRSYCMLPVRFVPPRGAPPPGGLASVVLLVEAESARHGDDASTATPLYKRTATALLVGRVLPPLPADVVDY